MRRERSAAAGILSLALLAAPGVATARPFAGEIDWSGFYAGVQFGGGLNLVDVQDPFGPSIYGDTVRTSGALVGLQAGYNWQWDAFVLGIEADADAARIDGTDTCFAFSGFYNSANCRAGIDAVGTLTGRLGAALGPGGATFIYGKAGAAWAYGNTDAIPNGGFLLPGSGASGMTWGWTLGAGAEQALDANWSLRAEYDFTSFGNAGLMAPASEIATAPNVSVPFPGAATHFSQDLQTLKLGLNYRFGERAAYLLDPPPVEVVHRFEIEAGARYVYGWGRFQKDLGIQNQGDASLASRLTYDGMTTNGGEIYARIDAPFNVMVKGLVGTGSGGGELTDEDWGIPFAIFVPYSNTLSDVDNEVDYATLDVGYDLWRGPLHRVAWFVGYSYFRQDMKASGCTQLANPNSDCVPPIPTSVLAITEIDQWRAMRLGAVADLMLAPRLKLTGEVAYLPYVSFEGSDDHVLRALYSPEFGEGLGVELEGMLSYALTDWLSVGIGGRYWSMWTTSGSVDFGGTGTIVPMRYAAEQAAVFVQGSYTLGTGL